MIIIFLFVSTLGIQQTAQKVRLVLLEPPIDITDGQVNDSIQSHFKSQNYLGAKPFLAARAAQ